MSYIDSNVPQHTQKLRILVVDDAESNRKVLSRLLEGKYETQMACDGDVAVDMVVAVINTPQCFHMVLMDYMMPKMYVQTFILAFFIPLFRLFMLFSISFFVEFSHYWFNALNCNFNTLNCYFNLLIITYIH